MKVSKPELLVVVICPNCREKLFVDYPSLSSHIICKFCETGLVLAIEGGQLCAKKIE